MDEKKDIEVARNILHSALSREEPADIIIRLSQEVDKHIIEYYKKLYGKKDTADNTDETQKQKKVSKNGNH